MRSCLVAVFCGLLLAWFVPQAGASDAGTGEEVLVPRAPGDITYSEGAACIDASNIAEGYIMISCLGNTRAKVRIARSGGAVCDYDLRTDGLYEVFPITAGDGAYEIAVYHAVAEGEYICVVSCRVDVLLRDAALPFLYPNKYVAFEANSAAVKKAAELAKGLENEYDIVNSIYAYVAGNIDYDEDKARLVTEGKQPFYSSDIDLTLATGKGICLDYAVLTTAMLRSQGIPARMEIGYDAGAYHAWVSVYLTGSGWIGNSTYCDGGWEQLDPTVVHSCGGCKQMMDFIADDSHYQRLGIY